ncbi:hypothetical protein BKA70DRAFT_753581 [Coprinopsis sp. MPI-PUGE-AT-0042]|nr:hypothetical protein BKA70DRAFT_753581 [Coprinopsis sp. MPI-PUGE-AT-0042]
MCIRERVLVVVSASFLDSWLSSHLSPNKLECWGKWTRYQLDNFLRVWSRSTVCVCREQTSSSCSSAQFVPDQNRTGHPNSQFNFPISIDYPCIKFR